MNRYVAWDSLAYREARTGWLRPVGAILTAFRSISVRQWMWATGIASIVLVAYVLSIANAVFGVRPVGSHWRAPEIVTTIATHLVAAYSVLLAVTVVERFGSNTRRHYVVAAVSVTAATVALEMVLIAVFPSASGWNFVPDRATWMSRALWSVTNWALTIGMVVAVYAWVQRARHARDALDGAERERAVKRRELLASQLSALQAQVEPQFLLNVLAQTEALYDYDAESGRRMLDELIAFLRAALPQLRGYGSDLDREGRLCEAYLRIVELRMGGRLRFTIDIPSDLRPLVFPPMLLVPLIDRAIRTGLEPLAFGGSVEVRARADESHLCVEVSHTGLQPFDERGDCAMLETLHGRLEGFYDGAASLRLVPGNPQGSTVSIEVPRERARNRR